jgi:hypothetical protein
MSRKDRFDGDPPDYGEGGDAAASAHGLTFPSLPDLVMARTIDIANRLRFVCADLDPDELLALATRMAMVEVKYSSEHPELRAERRMRRTG